jgi:hypothetical protein
MLSPTYIGLQEKNIIFLVVCIARGLFYVWAHIWTYYFTTIQYIFQ